MFYENQKFRQWWIWLPLLLIAALIAYLFINQILLGKTIGSKPASDVEILFILLIPVMLIALFYLLELKTTISETSLKFQFRPFVTKKMEWKEIERISIINYPFVGYGIRLGTKFGTVYNMKGNEGMYIEMKKGKNYLLGTQKKEELVAILKKLSLDNNFQLIIE